MSKIDHYLRRELLEWMRTDPEAFLSFLQKGTIDGLWYLDLENPEEEWMSDRMWEVLGHSPKPHTPASWLKIIDPEDGERAQEMFNAHLADPNVPYDLVVKYTAADGSPRWVRCRGMALPDAQGKPVRLFGAHNDVTPFKKKAVAYENLKERLESRTALLEAANAELMRINENLADFAYVASHDLQEPLRTITSFLEVLKEELGELNGEAEEALQFVVEASVRMKDLIQGLLEYSR